MAKYFNYFPQTYYAFSDDPTAIHVVTNLTNKFSFEESFKNNTSLFYEYDVVDGETPEILAHKVYGSSERHWIILAMNDIYNPQMDWPVENRALHDIIDYKYTGSPYANTANGQTGLEWAQTNNHSFYKLETQIDNSTTDEYKKKTQVDANTYNELATSSTTYTLDSGNTITVKVTKESKTYYQYEIDANDEKRTIKILKPEYVSSVEQEFQNIFR